MMMQIRGTKRFIPKGFDSANLVYCLFLGRLGLKIVAFLMLMGKNLIPNSHSWVMDSYSNKIKGRKDNKTQLCLFNKFQTLLLLHNR